MGIYPNYNGATCVTIPFSSSVCPAWSPKSGGRWYVSNRSDIPEPNGDNNTEQSMYYEFSGGIVSYFSDITPEIMRKLAPVRKHLHTIGLLAGLPYNHF